MIFYGLAILCLFVSSLTLRIQIDALSKRLKVLEDQDADTEAE